MPYKIIVLISHCFFLRNYEIRINYVNTNNKNFILTKTITKSCSFLISYVLEFCTTTPLEITNIVQFQVLAFLHPTSKAKKIKFEI